MGLPSEPDRTALQLAERLIQLLDRGGFTATYKYAVLIAIMDLCMEQTGAAGDPPDSLTTRQLAEKVIELYWPHCAPYGDHGVLRQSSVSRRKGADERATQAEIIQAICVFRESTSADPAASLSLAKARAAASPDTWEKLVRLIEWKLVEMPLPRLQRIGREEEERFLYDYRFTRDIKRSAVTSYQRGETTSGFDNLIRLMPGVSRALVALNGLLRPLIHRNWALMVAAMNDIERPHLEEFLFGSERISLDPVRPRLFDLQKGLCFYCNGSMSKDLTLDDTIPRSCHVDHFVPWSRHADNSIDNLVAAHSECNGKKSDYLAAADHVERWRERSARHEADLATIAREVMWESQPARTLGVARAIYRMLPEDARLWHSGQSFVRIERDRITLALAA